MMAGNSHKPVLPSGMLDALDPVSMLRKIRGLRSFLRGRESPGHCFAVLRSRMANREGNFLGMLRRGVSLGPENAFRRLLDAADITQEDVVGMVRREGVEGTLRKLREAGVYLSLEEFKGRKPVVRGATTFAVSPTQFRNPWAGRALSVNTGGSRGKPSRVNVGYSYLEQCVINFGAALLSCADEDAPVIQWFPILPSSAGLPNILMCCRLGRPARRWFAQSVGSATAQRLTTHAALWLSRLYGRHAVRPERADPSDAGRVLDAVRRLLDREGRCILVTYVSAAVRMCRVALSSGLRLEGLHALVSSEPLTEGRRSLIESTGARVTQTYWMTEIGLAGVGCPHAGRAPDELHVFQDTIAVIGEEALGEPALTRLYFTPLLPGAPQLFINLDLGDGGHLYRAPCSCPLGKAGLTLRVSHVQSTARITAEGGTVPAYDLLDLVDGVLPKLYGGVPTDYQIVEETGEASTRVVVRVNPRLAGIDADAVRQTVLSHIGRRYSLTARLLERSRALEVRRAPPLMTDMGKTQPVVICRVNPNGPR